MADTSATDVTLTVELVDPTGTAPQLCLDAPVELRVIDVQPGHGNVSGKVYEDNNRSGFWEDRVSARPPPRLIFVFDTSGSTEKNHVDHFDPATPCRYEVEIAGLVAMNRRLIDLGLGESPDLGHSLHRTGGYAGGPAGGPALFSGWTYPTADVDDDSEFDIEQTVRGAFDFHVDTDYGLARGSEKPFG